MSVNYWETKNVMVTGGAGFLGRVLVGQLEKKNPKNIFIPHVEQFDLTSKEAIEEALKRSNPDIIIHLAALCGGIGANRAKPGEFFYKNLIMGVQLMELARLRGVKKFVAIGTICAYPKFCPVPFKEENLWDGYPEETNAPYGLAKKMLLVQSQAYRQQYNFNSVFLLPVNMYGPGDNFDLETSHVIPALIRKFHEAKLKGEKGVVCWGTGKVSREFLYVKDSARAILMAAEQYDGGDPVNIGSGQEITIYDLVLKIKKLVGFEGGIRWDPSKPDGQPRRCLDTSKAKKLFDFTAATNLDEGLVETYKWYEQNTGTMDCSQFSHPGSH